MTSLLRSSLPVVLAFAIFHNISCSSTTRRAVADTYTNPVFEPILADPTVVRADDGWFYAYGTQDDWGDGHGSRLIPVVKSKDLTGWTYVRNAFDQKPSWKPKGGIWAPDVVKVNGQYHMYYAFSIWADPDPGIGLAVSSQPEGPFTDLGKLFLSSEVKVPNSIDPFFYDENGKKYLFWGSYSDAPNQGTYVTELTDDGKAVRNLAEKKKIAAGDFEAVVIHKRGNFYYFIGSRENCCNGAESKYHLRVGRSEHLMGPYYDKDGKLLTERGAGTVILEGNEMFAGTGHNSRIITDDKGNDWTLYHAILKANPRVPSGANRRVLMLDRIVWKDDWPTIPNQKPEISPQKKPQYK